MVRVIRRPKPAVDKPENGLICRRKRNSKLGGDFGHGLATGLPPPAGCEFALQRLHILALARIGQTELSKIAVQSAGRVRPEGPGFARPLACLARCGTPLTIGGSKRGV